MSRPDRSLYAEKDGKRAECTRYRYAPLRSRANYIYWRCGLCKRGKLNMWDKVCKVCHATIVPVIETPKEE